MDSRKPTKGDIYSLPDFISDRLFCFHLVDNTRGQTLPFAPEEIKESHIEIEVENINSNSIDIKISKF